ncbi:glycosyltransferase [Neisseria sp. S1]|uniref:glycosyltransferase n=1 Tax=Neisseria sp. S1 TaxID=3318354 RepID=UPI003A879480
MRKVKSNNRKHKQAKKIISVSSNTSLQQTEMQSSFQEETVASIKEKYHKSLLAFRELTLEYENKMILLKEQNKAFLAEKQSLTETIKEYETLYKEWSAEKKNLTQATQRAILQAENCKQTKSFRLGYALIFGFKSWQGFKDMCSTLRTLYKERHTNAKKTFVSLNFDETLKQPPKKYLSWESQKPVLQWSLPRDTPYLANFNTVYFNENNKDDILVLDKTGIETVIDCSQFNQLIIKTNIFSKEHPQDPKQGLLTIAFYNEEGKSVQPSLNLPFSQRLGKHYFYLNSDESLDDYIFLLIPQFATRVALGLVHWDNKSEISYHNALNIAGLSNGISVILPTYQGEKTIIKCLQSLAKQTLPFSEFEILIVINGEQDSTPALIERFKETVPQMRIRIFELEEGNVSKARNYAIQQASKGWITFIDDDDFVPENYLNSLYQYAIYNTITVTGIEDILNGEVIRSSIMDQLDKAAQKADLSYFDTTSSLTMNACKLAPSFMVKNTIYNTSLRSGEDVVYWCQLLNQFRPKVTLIPHYEEDSYKRLIRENSISRKAESYDFNVLQRLEVIKLLIDELKNSQYKHIDTFIQSKIDAQAGFIKRYLQQHPQEYETYLQDITRLDLHNPFIGQINSLFTDTLVISYCFAPYIDTSGVVMSKRIRSMGKPVDLITNSMSQVREADRELLRISEYYLGKHHELNAPQSFANWNAIAQFADSTLDATHNMLKHREMYSNLYSRAMWPASHIAAALVKIKYPQMKWIAEFSDPILMDVSAQERYEELPTSWLKKHGFIPHSHALSDKQNLFYWCEKLPYLYADELVFTNQNQLDYMLSYADENLRETIRNKAVIQPQPTLDRSFYQLSQIKLEKDPDKFHLAYFGSFYVNRGFKPFIDAWCQLPETEKKLLNLHIYTQQEAESIVNNVPEELKEQIVIQKYVGYFDFLALSDQFDGLIVMDAETKGLKINNPYLPSKLSDYLGSQSLILALTEQGSPMFNIEHNNLCKVNMFNLNEIHATVSSLLHNKL